MHYRIFSRSFAFIILLIVTDIALVSCYKSKTYNYKYVRALLGVMEADSVSGEKYLGIDNDSLKADKLFMDVHFGSEVIAKASHITAPMFMTTAMAMQPNEDYYINQSRIKNIKVTALSPYSNNYPAGSDITSICVFGYERPRYGALLNEEEFIQKFNAYLQENEKVFDAHVPSEMFWFRFTENAQLQTTQQVEITIEMEDGTLIRSESLKYKLIW